MRARHAWQDADLDARTHHGRAAASDLDDTVEAEPRWSAAEREVLARTRERLAWALDRVCPVELRASADDIVQLAMLRVMRVMARERAGEGLTPPTTSYLCKVAYTTMVDELRKARSQARVRDNAAQAMQAGPAPTISPEANAGARQISAAIRACLEGLSESRRRPVILHLQGHSVPEAGEVLGWSRKRTENQVYRGLADLRACLRNKGFEP